MSSGDRDRRHRDDGHQRSRSRHTSDHRQHERRTSAAEDRKHRTTPQDKRDQTSRQTRRFTEDPQQHVAQPNRPGASAVHGHGETSHDHIHTARQQEQPVTAAASGQAVPVAAARQQEHRYLADNLRENRHTAADSIGYVSNRDRQQSHRQHPYQRSNQHDYRDRGHWHRSGEESRQRQDRQSTGMIADRHGANSGFNRQGYGRSQQEWPGRGRGFSGGGGGFGGGGKWKHDMFEELAKESQSSEANQVASVQASTAEVGAAQQDAAPPAAPQ